ncbi:MAG: hypothetical protein ACK4UJ_07315 [Leptonema sp. (in: bacteria)]
MKETTEIRTFYDLIKVLKEHPEFLEELRRLILTEELLNLPKKFEEFLKNEFQPLKKEVDVLKQDVAVLRQDVKILKDDVSQLKGSDFERKVREKTPAFFGRLIRKCRLISFEDLASFLDDKVEENVISEQEKEEILNLDVVVSGYLKNNKEKRVILAAEVSLKPNEEDLIRAKKRSEVLGRAYGFPCIAVVIGKEKEKEEKLIKKAEELDVILI